MYSLQVYKDKADSKEAKPDLSKKIVDIVETDLDPEKPFKTRFINTGIYLKSEKVSDKKENQVVDIEYDKSFKDTLPTGEFFPVFPRKTNQNHRIIVSGPSGSGKSTICGHILEQLVTDSYLENQKDPNIPIKQIFIFSFVNKDPVLDRPHGKPKIKARRVNMDLETLESLEVSMFKNSIVIYDDCEKYHIKKLKNVIIAFRDLMAENGRHDNIDILSISHNILNGNDNRNIRQESTGIFLFPLYAKVHETRNYLKEYIGLDNKQIVELMTLDSRWVYISTMQPTYYISRDKVKLFTKKWDLY